MKTYIPYSLLLAAAASGLAFGQTAYTTPVGYTTSALASGQFSFVGLTVHTPTKFAGVISAESSNSVTVGGTDFVALLGTPNPSALYPLTYVLELPNGTIQEITNWTNTGVLTTPENITAQVVPGTTTFKLRKAATISDIFGATNSAGLKPDTNGNFDANADVITVIGAGGVPTKVYYFNDGAGTQGWFDANNNEAQNLPLVYADGFYVKRQVGSLINLVVSGEVKTVPTSGSLINGFNFLSPVAPVGLTLDSSNLKNFVSASGDGNIEAVDNVLLPQANGSFITAYYFNDGAGTVGWFQTNNDPAGQLALEGGFLVLNRGLLKPYTLSVPTYYSSL